MRWPQRCAPLIRSLAKRLSTPSLSRGGRHRMNKFDDVKLDVPRLLAEQRLKFQTARNPSGTSEGRTILALWQMRFRRRVTEILVDWRIWDRLVYANVSLGWFREFERYWVGELGLRPITPPDFHFLKGVYRQRFQTLVDVSDANALE